MWTLVMFYFNLYKFQPFREIYLSIETIKKGEKITKFNLIHGYGHITDKNCFIKIFIIIFENLLIAIYILTN